MAHARAIALATDLPVSADLENGFGPAPAEVASTICLAAAAAAEAARAVCTALTRPVSFMVSIKGKSFSVAELEAAGVRCIGLATSLYRAAMAGLTAAATEVKRVGSFGHVERL